MAETTICVENLSSKATEDILRHLFSTIGPVQQANSL